MSRAIGRPVLGATTVIVAVAAVAAVIFVILSASGGNAQPRTGRGPHGTTTPFSSAGGPLIPKSGAYLGAFVQPLAYNVPSEIEAVTSFEHQLGHSLGIVHVYHIWTAPFPSAADTYFADHGQVLLITWGGTPDTKAIIAGKYDRMIRARAEAVKRLGHPVLLEFRHEMDRPDLQGTIHSPADYIAAWDHIRSIFAAVGTHQVGWVWCPTAQGFQTGRAQPFYPGDNAVDWVCADAYSTSPSQPLGTAAAAFLQWASQHPKPVLIGEFGVRSDPAGWAAWLLQVGQLARQDTQIKALTYFDADGSSSHGRPYSFSLNDNPAARSAFGALLAEPYFRTAEQQSSGDN